jgi:ParB family chromosome partitioning protein
MGEGIMARRNVLADLIGDKLPAGNSTSDASAEPASASAPAVPFQGALAHRGAIGAISRSIAGLTNAASDAETLRAQLTAGQTIIELSPDLLDPSPIADRLDRQDDTDLIESIRTSGQQVPILVRPHPQAPGRYQIAYGHRRARALRAIARPIRAVVRDLSDAELVVAQGQENNARRDLSYIERALYAAKLEEAGYGRDTIMAALAVDKTALSKLISSAVKIPRDIIEAIGPAPGLGRNRWVALSSRLDGDDGAVSIAREALSSPAFAGVDTNDRFEIIDRALQKPKALRDPLGRPLLGSGGAAIGTMERAAKGARLQLPDEGFAEFLADQLPRLHAEYQAGQGRSPS